MWRYQYYCNTWNMWLSHAIYVTVTWGICDCHMWYKWLSHVIYVTVTCDICDCHTWYMWLSQSWYMWLSQSCYMWLSHVIYVTAQSWYMWLSQSWYMWLPSCDICDFSSRDICDCHSRDICDCPSRDLCEDMRWVSLSTTYLVASPSHTHSPSQQCHNTLTLLYNHSDRLTCWQVDISLRVSRAVA